MRVLVTALKAPWPSGTQIGDIVELPGRAAVPEWAVGKCEPAPERAAGAEQAAAPAASAAAESAAPVPAPAAKRAANKRGG